jgi:hypothetical protein
MFFRWFFGYFSLNCFCMQILSQIYELERGMELWNMFGMFDNWSCCCMHLCQPFSMLFLLCDFATTFIVILQQLLLQSLLWLCSVNLCCDPTTTFGLQVLQWCNDVLVNMVFLLSQALWKVLLLQDAFMLVA